MKFFNKILTLMLILTCFNLSAGELSKDFLTKKVNEILSVYTKVAEINVKREEIKELLLERKDPKVFKNIKELELAELQNLYIDLKAKQELVKSSVAEVIAEIYSHLNDSGVEFTRRGRVDIRNAIRGLSLQQNISEERLKGSAVDELDLYLLSLNHSKKLLISIPDNVRHE